MDFRFTEKQEGFRQELIDFCKTEPYGEVDPRVTRDFSPTFFTRVAGKGWLGVSIPREYGGLGYGMTEQAIFYEEMAYHKAPVPTAQNGTAVVMAGTFIRKYGSEALKKSMLPRISRGEVLFGQSFTESEAGSDLLAVQTAAERQGDYYLLNGSKQFQSWVSRVPHLENYGIGTGILLLARTKRDAPPDRSLSLFVLDVKEHLAELEARPAVYMDGKTACEIFFDNIRIPASTLIGEENRAWEYFQESGSCFWDRRPGYFVGYMRGLLQNLVEYVKQTTVDGRPLRDSALIRHKLAEIAIQAEAVRLDTYRFTQAVNEGGDNMGLGAVMKFHTDRLYKYFSNTAMQILGPCGQLKAGARYAPLKGVMETTYRAAVQRTFVNTGLDAMVNCIAGQVLGLPNEFGLIF